MTVYWFLTESIKYDYLGIIAVMVFSSNGSFLIVLRLFSVDFCVSGIGYFLDLAVCMQNGLKKKQNIDQSSVWWSSVIIRQCCPKISNLLGAVFLVPVLEDPFVHFRISIFIFG